MEGEMEVCGNEREKERINVDERDEDRTRVNEEDKSWRRRETEEKYVGPHTKAAWRKSSPPAE